MKQASGGSISFGTRTFGRVIERPLRDGRARVTVLLFTKDALAWVAEGCDFLGTLLFGNRAPDVLSGAMPALADSFLQFVFINTAPGAPLPDLIQITSGNALPGQELVAAHFEATAALGIKCNSEEKSRIPAMTDLEIFVSSKNYGYALWSCARMKQHEIVKCLFRLQED